MKILIKGGRVIDPAQSIDKKSDLLVENGRISRIAGSINAGDAKKIDAEGMIVAPGLIDMHAHLREPGREDAETIHTGLKAAVSGGFTTVVAMPNTDPPCDSEAHVRFLLDKAGEAKLANLVPVGAVTKGREGMELSEMGELKQAGCLAVSDDGSGIENAELMRRALEYARMCGLLVISHCEDKALSGDGVMNEGYWSTVLGMKPIPAEAEATMVERDIRLAELTGARLHIAHVSAGQSVDIIRDAKKRGVKVSAEVTPHHFSLTDEAVRTFDANFKVNPPLRTEKDVKAVIKGLREGTIDVIATDHAPHPANDKEKEFDYAPFGMIGFETALSVSVMNLVDTGALDWNSLISKFTRGPRAVLGCDRGTLKPGAGADIVVIDPGEEWVYSRDKIASRSKNSPFIGAKMKAKVKQVIAGGRIVLTEGPVRP